MPLHSKTIIESGTLLYIWKIDEPLEILINTQLTEVCLVRLFEMKSLIHKKGFLSVRHLLKAANLSPEYLYYNDNGKPHLADGRSISITHSGCFSAILISTKQIGIDIEQKQDKIQHIAPKFTNTVKQDVTTIDAITYLTALWCIKESVYKAVSEKGLSLKNHIHVGRFSQEKQPVSVFVNYQGVTQHYQAIFFEIEKNYMLAYALGHL